MIHEKIKRRRVFRYLESLTVFLVFASLKDLEAPLVNRVVKETEAVDCFDNSTGERGVIP